MIGTARSNHRQFSQALRQEHGSSNFWELHQKQKTLLYNTLYHTRLKKLD